ncbi:MAG: LytTR family DNA-binding domain-containing protein [Bacteroidota bacterium]
METIRAIIVEDIDEHRDLLLKYLRETVREVEVLCTCKTLTDAINQIEQHKPDLVFLDLRIGAEDGMVLLKVFQELPFDVIFVTVLEDMLLKSLRHAALDYIQKPVTRERVREAVSRYKSPNGRLALKRRYSILLKDLAESESANKTFVYQDRKNRLVEVLFGDVIFIEAQGAYSSIKLLSSPQPIIQSKNIGELEKNFFPSDLFFRCHKSYLINMLLVNGYSQNKGITVARMINGETITIAARRTKNFKELYKEIQKVKG